MKILLFGISFLLCGAPFIFGEAPSEQRGNTNKKPNIVLFLVDDMGWQDTSVPFYYEKGKPIKTSLNKFYKTPAMEKLAESGMKFINAYAAPVCSPSRTSIMTGKTPAHHRVSTWTAAAKPILNDERLVPGFKGTEWRMAGMDKSEITLPQVLKSSGYRNIHVGKAHFAPNDQPYKNPCLFGFDVNIAGNGIGGPGSYRSDQNFVKGNPLHQVPGMDAHYMRDKNPTEEELKQNFLTNALTQEMEKQITQAVKDKVPFFAYMTHYAVHSTHEDPDPNADKNMYSNSLPVLPKGIQQNKNNLANFATLIEGMDKSLADIRAHLQKLGIAKNTLIIFMSDNGGDAPIQQNYSGNMDFVEQVGAIAPLRGRKGSRYEGGTRVPLIVAWAQPDKTIPLQRTLNIKSNSYTERIVGIWDLFPTITSICGASSPKAIDGVDISGILRNDKTCKRANTIYHHFPHSHTYGQYYSTYRDGDWKVLYSYKDEYEGKGVFPWKLFNLKEDISESNDLAALPEHKERLMRMAKSLQRELTAVNAQYPRLTNPKNPNQVIGTALMKMPRL